MSSKLKSIFGAFLRSLHTFWLEVIGCLFLAFGVMFGIPAVLAYRSHLKGGQTGMFLVLSEAGMSLLMFLFGVRSFWKARKLR